MAIVKVGKKVINGVAALSIKDSNTNNSEMCLNIVGYMGNLETIIIPKHNNVRLEVTPGDNITLPLVESSTCLTVLGNVDYAHVPNVLTVEGMVSNTSSPLDVNKYLKVTYGRERNIRENIQPTKERAHVIRVEGDLRKLRIDVTNINIENIVFGNVANIEVGNCLYVKGVVNKCNVGNHIECTMGKSLAKSTSAISKQRKNREKHIDKYFN